MGALLWCGRGSLPYCELTLVTLVMYNILGLTLSTTKDLLKPAIQCGARVPT